MASVAAAPSTHPPAGQFGLGARARAVLDQIEHWLEAERDQLPLWLPVSVGTGVALWFVLPNAHGWLAAMLFAVGLALAALALGRGGRLGRVIAIGAIGVALGTGLVWWRAERAAAPVLNRPVVARFTARVDAVEMLGARGLVRVTLSSRGAGVDSRGRAVVLPARVRVTMAEADAPVGLASGAMLRLSSRLLPPSAAAVPGAYDFARVAWFSGIGATGRAIAPIRIESGSRAGSGIRDRLTAHITGRLEGSAGGIAAALATGDEGAIEEGDDEAMRRAGLAHLLSVSGLHITAAVAATMFVVMRLLALSPWLALRVRLPVLAGLAGAAAAIGYTLLTGSQVPTIRSCVAALLVLVALMMGREAVTLRLVATGALVVLLWWPEQLAGPSFQLSFAAITAIVALHEHPRIAAFFGPHEEPRWRRAGRGLLSLLLTGVVVEAALMPIAVFHFHKAGLYGAAANIVAIPLTTFVVMPAEALALMLDTIGLGGPAWWVTGRAIALLLWLAQTVAAAPGSIAALPAMPTGAFALMIGGGLWLMLWRTSSRWAGAVPIAAGALWALLTPAPDLLVTGDGRHLAIRTTGGGLALLRDRAGDYTRSTLAENGGLDGEPLLLAEQREARCSRDLCLAEVVQGGRRWRLLATRSAYPVPWAELVAACARADIAISERALPRACKPRWLLLDKRNLSRTGGVAVTLATGRVYTVRHPGDEHPWRAPPTLASPANDWRRHP
ncbi:ComEC/Rec2 family competence protein [Sphingomonas aerophila]|uniref:Competence protein ComEC n=1 Tax=Sphingomonas aerophila TaxID=1344948 RepID=A0A7W9BBJ0_9SPHN|nr:ComEC/Rec2 family competence protein [Sphingomonas aerophila]MBB5713954.1 competence protein ComEC [Sphingomonas aerophila]